MKRKLLCLITALVMLFAVGIFAVACTNTDGSDEPNAPAADAVAYSVTVKNPDGSFASGITVSWQNSDVEYGKAVTDADGKATAQLSPATYRVVLSGLEGGITAPAVSVTSGMRDITLTLSYEQIKYTATVIDKTGAPAANVTVTWVSDKTTGTAQTNAEGVAECTLDYDEYTVTVSNLPAGNIAGAALVAYGNSPAVRFELVNGETMTCTITVRSEGGLKFANKQITVYKGPGLVGLGNTDENGTYTFTLPKGDYRATIKQSDLPDGYTVTDAIFHDGMASAEIVAHSQIISELPQDASFKYVIGDIFHDYSFTTPYNVDGAPVSLKISEILEAKKMIMLNFWGTGCSWCLKEMPAMEEIYNKYKDDIEIIAVNNYMAGTPSADSDSTIVNYYLQTGYSFPMMRDTYDFAAKFSITGWPVTVVIDRYGAIARIESGVLPDENLWDRLVEMYGGEKYTQTFVPGEHVSESISSEVAKPDVTLPSDHYEQVGSVINNTDEFPDGATVEWYGAPDIKEYEFAWPFVLGTDEDVSPTERVLYASNTGKHNSFAALFATVKAPAGSVFTFDYYLSTEQDDVVSFVWDGMIVKQMSGLNTEWQTCKLYVDITTDEHTLAIMFKKDSGTHGGKDNIFFRNVRFTSLSDMTETTDLLRAAAYGTPEDGATRFPHYAPISLGNDGYYHVNLSGLENDEFAGNDQSPLLFANLRNATNWLGVSLNELMFYVYELPGGEYQYAFDTVFTINGVTRDYRNDLIEYMSAAGYSDIPDYVPVDKDLHDLLIAFMTRIKQTLTVNDDENNADEVQLHENEWLEVCYFYSHYGAGEPVGNPIMGLTKKTAYQAALGTNTVNLYRVMSPFSTAVFTFTPEQSAVYKFESLLPAKSQQAAQIWVYDDNTTDEKPLAHCGDEHVTRTAENEHNFELYMYLEAGRKYYMTLAYQMQEMGTYDFKITNVGQSASVLMPTAGVSYVMQIDENDNITGFDVSNPVGFTKDAEGYYHALNADGTEGSYIYLDVKYANAAMGTISLEAMLNRNFVISDGIQNIELDFKTFDFSKAPIFVYENDEYLGIANENDISGINELYKDYTDRLREIVESAPTSGDTAGMVRVDDEIKQILELFAQLRTSSVSYQMVTEQFAVEEVLPNEWLRYCWYFRLYDQNNV